MVPTIKQITNEELTREIIKLREQVDKQTTALEIEACLEKVRAKSLAMHKSDDLIEVVKEIGKEISKLGIDIDNSQIFTDYTHDPKDGLNIWVDVKGQNYLEKFHIPYIDHFITQYLHKALNEGQNFFGNQYSKSDKDSYFKLLFKYSDLSNIPNERKELIFNAPGWTRFTVVSDESCLHFGRFNLDDFTDEEKEIFRRIGRVFGQAYTRFLDLQKAEKLTLETARQSSLDRIRAEIASMRSAEDLNQITPIIWDELKTLEIPFIRCGVFIIDEEKQISYTYLSTSQGDPIAVLHLPIEGISLIENAAASWKKKEIFTEHWDKDDFHEWTQNLVDGGFIHSKKKYEAGSAPESLYLHFLPFKHGMLYIGSTEPLLQEKLDLGQSMANAFSVAYDRYEDFNKLEQAKRKIEEAFQELEAAKDQLVQQEKLASLGQLTAGIAHEIKNPLNFVNNFSDMSVELIKEALDELKLHPSESEEITDILNDIAANIQKVHEHGTRADGIVKSMLQHSRGGSGKMEPTDLNALVKEYANLAFHGMRAGNDPINVDIRLELDEEAGEVKLIAEDFSRVILNLCNNAFDAMRSLGAERSAEGETYEPLLTVRTRRDGESVTIEIQDNGPGIPDEIKDKILQPFFTTKKGTAGTGLGLSITHDIIKAHGGEMNIKSDRNGTTFSITMNL